MATSTDPIKRSKKAIRPIFLGQTSFDRGNKNLLLAFQLRSPYTSTEFRTYREECSETMEYVSDYTEAAKVILTSHTVFKYNSDLLLQILTQVDLNLCIIELLSELVQFKVDTECRSELKQNIYRVVTNLKLKIDPKLQAKLK